MKSRHIAGEQFGDPRPDGPHRPAAICRHLDANTGNVSAYQTAEGNIQTGLAVVATHFGRSLKLSNVGAG